MFLTIEGIDGAGKTTLCGVLQRRLPNALVLRKKEFLLHAPLTIRPKVARLYEDIWGDASACANIVRDRPLSDILLMAGWFHLIELHVIQPSIAQGRTVILDGWFYKFLCRFKARDRDELSLLESLLVGLRKPSIGVYLNISPQIAAERKPSFTASECGVLDGYKTANLPNFIAYQRNQKAHFDDLAKSEGWGLLDAETLQPEQLADEILQIIAQAQLGKVD
jgi:dTMP kinase